MVIEKKETHVLFRKMLMNTNRYKSLFNYTISKIEYCPVVVIVDEIALGCIRLCFRQSQNGRQKRQTVWNMMSRVGMLQTQE